MIDKIQENKYLDINIRFYFFLTYFIFNFVIAISLVLLN